MHRLVMLVELPPASRLDGIMFAELFPRVLWLTAAGTTRQGEVSSAMANLRLAPVNMQGALINRLDPLFARLSEWAHLGLVAALGFLGVGSASAQQTNSLPAATNAFLSAVAAGPRLAPWQQRLTLGPGDAVNLSVYGRKDLNRADVPVGPDGRISYLQVQDVLASGLTVDELREKLNQELARFDRHLRVIVTPAAYRSKKYFLLGTIMDRGAYTLDRPLTIIEAIARARGIATGLLEQNTVEIADLPRAFLVRNGARMKVDFEKLFQEGDLTQNILLEPGDYIYFPSSTANEVYILGAVTSPGTVGVTSKSTVVGVITTRGGFAPSAFTQRVLVVRGSLNQPQKYVVNVSQILAGKTRDFPLLPKDIVFVAERPWLMAEELLDGAIKTFMQSVTANWASQNIGPLITEPFIPRLP